MRSAYDMQVSYRYCGHACYMPRYERVRSRPRWILCITDDRLYQLINDQQLCAMIRIAWRRAGWVTKQP